MKLQKLINEANDAPKPLPPQSYDELISQIRHNMDEYKDALDATAMGKEFKPSDRKKMLTLPFQQARRAELPEPKKGQKEWDFFYELFGKEWDEYENLMWDKEEKITEFNYEKFIPKQMLDKMDTDSKDFKDYIKMQNLMSKTEYEQHKENQ